MKLIHYSGKDDVKLDLTYNYSERPRGFMKPLGLWVSAEEVKEDDQTWKTWCESEEFCVEHLKNKYLIQLKPDAKILYLTTPEEIYKFTDDFRDPDDYEPWFADEFVYKMQWLAVASIWDGIIIAPYQWGCRLKPKTSWYYGWDCSSGCIWNLNCIEKFELMEKECAVNTLT